MEKSAPTLLIVLLAAVAVGFFLPRSRPRARVEAGAGVPLPGRDGEIVPVFRTRELRIGGFVLGFSGEGTPGIWLEGSRGGALQMGVHANGYPFLLVSDSGIRNFGLGRVDGRNASPILVYRSDDIVKLVFGLDMTGPGQEPFLVHWASDGKKNLALGSYCDAASRACTN